MQLANALEPWTNDSFQGTVKFTSTASVTAVDERAGCGPQSRKTYAQ